MSEERRISKRVATSSANISIHDKIADKSMGTVGNLSETGFMLVTSHQIEIDSVFQLELKDNSSGQKIQIGAICLWNSETSSQQMFWSGFHIIDISTEAEEILKDIVDRLSD